jgi:hypothetical protein
VNPAAAALYTRARHVGFPALVLSGTVCAGATSWWTWVGAAPPAELEQAHRQLADFEARLHEDAARLIQRAREDADRAGIGTALDDRLDELLTDTLAPGRAAVGLAADYEGSLQAQVDREAAAALAALEGKAS